MKGASISAYLEKFLRMLCSRSHWSEQFREKLETREYSALCTPLKA